MTRDQLRENALLKKFYCDVNITDIIKYNEELAHRLVTEPAEIIPLVRPILLPTFSQCVALTRSSLKMP
jgi:DNA replication licensing factor MCM5